MSEITYDDKVDLQVATNIANINKVTASDMNEIKNVVNGNAEEVGDITSLTTTDKTSVVNAINELETDKLETSAVVNEPSTETDEVYSTEYLNNKLVSVGATSPTGGERVWFEKSKNMFNKNTITNGYRLDGSGIPGVSASNEFTSDYIAVKPSTQYVRNYGGTGAYIRTCFYDSTKTFISKDDEHQTFTTPSNARFLRFSEYTTNLNGMQVEEGSTATSYEAYINPSINVDNEQWYDKSLMIKSKYFSSITTSDTGYYDLGLISNEVAVIGIKHNAVDVATKLELYSNQLGHIFVRCSAGGNYVAKTIYNLTIYYI